MNPSPSGPETERRVVPFRPRPAKPMPATPPASPVTGLQRYERGTEADDYRQRMVANGVALAFLVLLVVGGAWLADRLAGLGHDQDCALAGRRNCTPIDWAAAKE